MAPGEKRALPGPRPPLPGRARGGAEAQGDQLHPRRGLSHRRDEARPDRAGRSRDALHLRGARGSLHAKTLSNVEEVRARHGLIISVGTEGDESSGRTLGRLPADPRRPRGRPAAPGGRAAPAPGLSRRPAPRLRHRQAAQPRQERDGGVIASGCRTTENGHGRTGKPVTPVPAGGWIVSQSGSAGSGAAERRGSAAAATARPGLELDLEG